MSGKTATIIGATGMIGTYLQQALIHDADFKTIRLMVRRPIPNPDSYRDNDKTEIKLVDFDDAESVKLALEGTDVVFCAIGTTRKNVKGDKELYRKVDYEIPVKVARFAKEAGCENFVLISSVGANPKSRTFYLRLKGELEATLQTIGFRYLNIMRPSVLLGDRKEDRAGEQTMQSSMKFLSRFFFGSWKKYKAIPGETVARAMIAASKMDSPGTYIAHYDMINKLAVLH